MKDQDKTAGRDVTEQDPALSQEDAREDVTENETVADPQATEDTAESEEKSEEGTGAQDKEQAPAFSIEVEGETPPAKKDGAAPQWLKDLRVKVREQEKELAEYRRQKAQEKPTEADPGEKPTMDSCGYDTARFEAELEAWKEKNRRKEAADAQATEQVAASQRAWKSVADGHAKKVSDLIEEFPAEDRESAAADYAEKEAFVAATILKDPLQQRLLMKYAKDAPALILAIAQHPNLGEDLAKIGDVIDFVDSIRALEARVKKTPTKPKAPPPERTVAGSGPTSVGGDSREKQLRERARETGDYSDLEAYKRGKR